MKPIYYSQNYSRILTMLFMVLALSLVSCKDVLEEDPKGLVVETYYTSAEEFDAATEAVYHALHTGSGSESTFIEFIVRLDTHTEWCYGRGSRAILNTFSGFTDIDGMSSYWSEFYLTIRNANLVIKNASGGMLNESEISSYVAEAKFLRALSYFYLVRGWSSVPLRTEDNMNTVDVEKSSVSDIYTLILSDLEYAESNLPEEQSEIGRATKYAAKTLLADVYLTLEEYEEARDKAYDVIQSGKFSLVPVSDKTDFQWDVFGPEITTSAEEIFYLKYTRQSGYGNWICWVLNHQSTGNFNYGGAYAHYSDSTNLFYTEWNRKDIRRSLWDNVDFGLGATTLVSSKYIDPYAIEKSLGAGNDMPVYRYSEALLIYAEASCMAADAPTTEGVEALNKVHRRAYGYDPESTSPVDFNITDYDASAFQDLVLQEKAYEFIFEGKRWWDLKRTGKAAEVIKRIRGIDIAERHYLWPIPTSEMDYNGALEASDQNPGY